MSWDPVLSPVFAIKPTKAFSVLEYCPISPRPVIVHLDWNCAYTRSIIRATCLRRPWVSLIERNSDGEDIHFTRPSAAAESSSSSQAPRHVSLADFENIAWEDVLQEKLCASAYLVRKGLSRKAQLARQIARYTAKHPESALTSHVPRTVIIDTWAAFERDEGPGGPGAGGLDVCGIPVPFGVLRAAGVREKLTWSLSEVYASHFAPPDSGDHDEDSGDDHREPRYILKPSVTNKGLCIELVSSFAQLLDALLLHEDSQREWVLQDYVRRPLLLRGHKFHVRTYVLCVGALRVFVFGDMLLLLAAEAYGGAGDPRAAPGDRDFDVFAHLTNTARAAEHLSFSEEKFVHTLRDLPALLLHSDNASPSTSSSSGEQRAAQAAWAEGLAASVEAQIHRLTGELFASYESEYSVFAPMRHCFELFGLDFLVDAAGKAWLLEANPGPDFVQTGERLRAVITGLWEAVGRAVLDSRALDGVREEDGVRGEGVCRVPCDGCKDLTLVYSKEWSVSRMGAGNMKMQ